MGSCVSDSSLHRSVEPDTDTQSVPYKHGTIGHNRDSTLSQDEFFRSRANAPPAISSPIPIGKSRGTIDSNDNQHEITPLFITPISIPDNTSKKPLIYKRRRSLTGYRQKETNPNFLNIPNANSNVSSPSCSQFSDGTIHNECKVKKYTKNSVDYASGQFANVFVSNITNLTADGGNTEHKKVAIKKIDIGDWISKTTKKSAEQELEILKLCQTHVNVVNLIDSFYEISHENLYLHICMEFVPSTLYEQILKYNEKSIPYKLIQIWSYQILRGINYINYIKNVIHRDLKPGNILIDPRTNEVKICDFGCSKKVGDNGANSMSILNFYVCSRYYRAPELLLESTHYGFPIDIWSFGCIISELYLGNILFDGINIKDQIKQIIKIMGVPSKQELSKMNEYYDYHKLLEDHQNIEHQGVNITNTPNWKYVFMTNKEIPSLFIDLISKILKYDPNERILPFDALNHECFDDLKQEYREKDTNENVEYGMPSTMFELNKDEMEFMDKCKL